MHHGKLVEQHRTNLRLTQEWLAEELHVHVRTIQRLENTAMIRNVRRRWFLVELLGIPASQLDLKGEPPWSQKTQLPVNNDLMNFFEHELDMRWQVYKTTGPVFAAKGFDIWMAQARGFAEASQKTPWCKRSLALLSMSYQLEGSILRDTLAYSQAHKSFQNAYHAAYEADNNELMAASLLRQGMVYMAQEHPFEAIKNFNGALDYIKDLSFPRLRGKLLQARAEAYARVQRSQDCWTSIGLATHILGREDEGYEQNQTIFSPSSVAVWKGLYSLMLHDYDRAITLFDKGLATYDPSFAPDRARFLSRKAEAYYGANKIGEAIDAAQEAFNIASSIGKNSTVKRVDALYSMLAKSRWNKEPGMKTLGMSLAQYHSSLKADSE